MVWKIFGTAALVLFTSQSLSAQKIEVEKKVPPGQFPPPALRYLDENYADRGRTRHYLEAGSDTTKFEAKFKWQGVCYSVEFFEDGSLKDTEKEIDFDDIPAGPRQKMQEVFDADFQKAKVKRVQQQTLPGSPALRYELEVKGKTHPGGWAMWEYLFTAAGDVVRKDKIILPSNNILLY